MPWRVTNRMDLKMQLINDWSDGYSSSMIDLSEKYGANRPTVYKWLKRHERFAIEGLKEKIRAPRKRLRRASREILNLLIQEKLKNRQLESGKIGPQLKRKLPKLEFPAAHFILA